MAISRMQQPRQLYGLGSLVKSIGKGVKNLIKSPVGKGLLLAGGFGLAGMGPFAGLGKTALGTKLFGPGAVGTSLIDKFKNLGPGTKIGVGGGLVSLLLADGFSGDEVKAITQDKVAVSKYLRDYYTKLNPDAKEPEIQEFIETNTSEYATGGRVGLKDGTPKYKLNDFAINDEAERLGIKLYYLKDDPEAGNFDEFEVREMIFGDQYATGGRVGLKDSVKFMTEKELEETMPGLARGEVKNYELKKKANRMEKLMELLKEYEKNKKAAGGRIGYAEGTPEGGEGKQFLLNKKYLELLKKYSEAGLSNADSKALKEANEFVRKIKLAAGGMPTGIMRTNQAGVMERDYRDEGGFVPVGIKERADDVPAMLSKNEFVMTADAVRGAGDGSIEKGAQRMYDQMKNLESKVA